MIRKGSKISWKWGTGEASGKVVETYTEKISVTIKGNEVTRNGTGENKALLIEQADGDQALKLTSEVEHLKK
ncbi:MAG: DUF2945 domain-containing protein [Lewinella sp.]